MTDTLCPRTLRWCAGKLREVSDRHGLNGIPTLETGHTRPGEFVVELNGIYADEWNRVEGERREAARRCWYFGTWKGAGHYFRDTAGDSAYGANTEQPFGYPDGTCQPHNNQEQGPAALRHLAGWTILAWWDRTEDKRFGCCSALILEGTFSFGSMVDALRERFPRVADRRELTLWNGKTVAEAKKGRS